MGPNATLNKCTLEPFSFVGMGATVRNGATIESYGVLAAGAVLQDS